MQTFSANEAKTQFGHFIDLAQREPVRVMRRDRVVGVMVSARDYEAMRAFDELKTRLYRPKFDTYINLELREAVLHDLSAAARWVAIGEPARYCRDRSDDMFIETALAARAGLVVSGDQDLLQALPIQGLRILNPQQALAEALA